MVLVDYIGIFFYMWQYFWPHTVYKCTVAKCFSDLKWIFQMLEWWYHFKDARSGDCLTELLFLDCPFGFL